MIWSTSYSRIAIASHERNKILFRMKLFLRKELLDTTMTRCFGFRISLWSRLSFFICVRRTKSSSPVSAWSLYSLSVIILLDCQFMEQSRLTYKDGTRRLLFFWPQIFLFKNIFYFLLRIFLKWLHGCMQKPNISFLAWYLC